MEPDTGEKRIEELEDRDLVRRLTVERAEYADEHLARVEAELAARGITLEAFLGTATVRLNDDEPQTLPVEEAVARLSDDLAEWDVFVVENRLGSALAVQKQIGSWSSHLRNGADYKGIRLLTSAEEARDEIRRFVRPLDPGEILDAAYGIEGWEQLTYSRSFPFAASIARSLFEDGAPYIVHSNRLRHLDSALADPLLPVQILIREEDWGRSMRALEVARASIDALLAEAEGHAERGDVAAELAAYDQLAELAPGDALVHFNRGVILMDTGRGKEAIESFLQAAPLVMADRKLQAHAADVRRNLESLMSEADDPLPAQHTVAQIAAFEGDAEGAEAAYRAILAAHADDSVAHLGLAQLCYEDGDKDAEAAEHFRRYLELEPDASGRAEIEEILNQMQ